MRVLRYLALIGILALPATYSHAQVSFGIGVGPAYGYGPPACQWGYYNYYPYSCAPYGYYGPSWFNGGIFIGAGPWFRGGYGYGYRGGYGWRGGYGYRGGWGRGGWGDRGGFRGGEGFHGGGFAGHAAGGGFHGGGGGFHGGGGGFHGGGGHR